MSYEYASDFHDRTDTARAFLFERVVFADRAAAFRGKEFQRTYRTSSEAVTLSASRYWFSPVRKNLLDFVGMADPEAHAEDIHGVGYEEDIDEDDVESAEKEEEVQQSHDDEALEKVQAKLAKSGKPVITYISRQDWGRRMLKPESHESLVVELKKLEEKYGWEVNVVAMDKLTRDEQIRLAAKSTVSPHCPFLPPFEKYVANRFLDNVWYTWKWTDTSLMDESTKLPFNRNRILLPRWFCRRL